MTARIERLFGHSDGFGGGRTECHRAARIALAFRDRIERGFGVFDLALGIHRFAGVHGVVDQRAADLYQGTEQRQVVYLRRKVARPDQPGPVAREPGQIAQPAQFLEPLVAVEIGFERNRRYHHVAVEQQQDALIESCMSRFEEMIGLELDRHILGDAVVDQDCAQKRRFRLYIARQLLRDCGLCRV